MTKKYDRKKYAKYSVTTKLVYVEVIWKGKKLDVGTVYTFNKYNVRIQVVVQLNQWAKVEH